MANPIIKIKRGTGAPSTTLQAGELAVDQTNENLYIGLADGSGTVTNQIIGGKGTFARKDANDVAFTGGSINGTTIGATTPSTGKFTDLEVTGSSTFTGPAQFFWGIKGQDGGSLYIHNPIDISLGLGLITGLADPVNDNDAARKKYVDDEISKLGTVFHYVGILGSELSDTTLVNGAFDLTKLSDQSPGSYYTNKDVVGLPAMVDQAFSDGVVVFNLKEGDSILKTATSWEKLDHVDAVVIPLDNDNEVSVSGNEQIGYTVGLASTFKTRVSNVESKTQNIDLAGTTAGNTLIKGKLLVDAADPYAAPEFAVKDLTGSEMVNINGDTAKIKLGDDMNPSTEVTVGKKLVVSDSGAPMLEVSPSSVILNMNMGTQTVQSWSTFQVKSMLGLEDNGTIALDVDGHLVGSVNSNNGTVPEIRGFIIDGGVY